MISIAIIGVGNVSRLHIEGLSKFPERAKIVALVDIFPQKANEKKEAFGLSDAKVFASHQEALASGIKIDLAHICTPPYVHASIAIDCMNAGVNVLVEKPMAASVSECAAMLEAEKNNDVTMGVVAQNRFRDDVARLKELSSQKIAGKIRVLHINSLWWRGHCYYDLWWRGTWEKEGGGPTLNHAVHHIDMLNWIQGELPLEVTSVLANVMHDNSEVEDLSFAILKYADGSIAEITSSVVHHGEEQGVVIQYENAKIATPFHCIAEQSMPNGFPEPNKALMTKIKMAYDAIPKLSYSGHTGQIEDMLSALENKKRPAITGQDGKMNVELITAIYKAGFQKKTIVLPITPNDEYYNFDGILKNAVRFYKKAKSLDGLEEQDIISTGRY